MGTYYAELSLHRWMLRDEVRNEAYRRALNHVVKPESVVLDMGAGTGILSIFSAQAGARKVYAVERTEIAAVARRMIASNGLAERIELFQSDLEDADLPEKVDIIVSEWMGGLGVDENMLAPLLMARDRWLKPGGTIVPGRVTAMAAPVSLPEYDASLEHWRSKPHGVDMSTIAALTAQETLMTQLPIAPSDLLAEPQPLWSHDPYTCSLAEADSPFRARLTYVAARAGKISALATWFTADMSDGQTLTNAVGAPDTHWGRMLFALERAVSVAKGEEVHVELHCDPSVPGSCEFYWSVQVADGPTEKHDTRGEPGT